MKKFFLKYILTPIIGIVVLIGIYSYAGNKKVEKKSVEPEYTLQNEEGHKLERLRLAIAEMDTLNPIESQNQNVQDISKLIFDSILELDENYQLQLGLAKEWAKINATQYVIKLKENRTFHDGAPFTAQDVIYTVEKIKQNPRSVYYTNVEFIKEIQKIDNTTITIQLEKEIPLFEYQLTFPILSHISHEANLMIGTGQYQIIEQTEEKIQLAPYKGSQKAKEETEREMMPRIEIEVCNTITEAYQKFKNGEIDMMTTTNLNIEDHIGSMGYDSKQFPDRQYDFLACNTENGILNQKEVRQAIACVIDKQDLIDSIYRGKGSVANSPLDYGSYLNIKETEEEQIELAKQYLTQGGWQEKEGHYQQNQNGKTITLQFNLSVNAENQQRVQVAEKIRQQLEQIGIPITVHLLQGEKYNQCIEKKDYELLLAGMQVSLAPDLNGYLGENNLANFHLAEVQEILLDINNITEENRLKQKYKRILEILQEEVPYVGLYFHTKTLLYQKDIRGNINPTSNQIFYHMDTWYREKDIKTR